MRHTLILLCFMLWGTILPEDSSDPLTEARWALNGPFAGPHASAADCTQGGQRELSLRAVLQRETDGVTQTAARQVQCLPCGESPPGAVERRE